MKKIVAGLSASLILAIPASAHEQEVRSAGAHVHGKGDAFLSITGDILSFDLSAPKANFMLADGNLADFSGSDLPSYSDLIGLPEKAGCVLASMDVEAIVNGQDHDHDEDAEMHDHESDSDDAHHGEDDDHENHDDHEMHEEDSEHADHSAHDEHAGHADYLISLSLSCKKPEHIRNVEFTFFETYTGFNEVNLIFAVEDDMIATTLDSKKTKVDRP